MTTLAVVDAGPLISAAIPAESHHRACIDVLSSTEFRLFIPAMVVTEACQLIERRLGPRVEARFVAGLAGEDVRGPTSDEWPRIAELIRQYADFPLGAADASVVALAERLDTDTIITLDRRHFGAVRPRHCDGFRLLP